jgi:hypothetical protein
LFDVEERRVQSHAVFCADLESVEKSCPWRTGPMPQIWIASPWQVCFSA